SFGNAELKHFAYVRFTNQLSDFEVQWTKPRLKSIAELDRLMQQFERVYTTVYPEQALESEAGYQVLEVALAADVTTPMPRLNVLPVAAKKPPAAAEKPARKVYYRGKRLEFRVYEMEELKAGNVVDGPGIIEHPATTLLIPPGHHAVFDNRRLIHYRKGRG
ncbi:MAG: hypothetical protein K8E66_01635, partial [Phycisphaerales bacterium]|nr:hypothetical protein [Phycisphaerales bacterium]